MESKHNTMKNYCLKWGSKYNYEDVNNLHRMLDGDLICITDDPSNILCETIPLPKISTKWWNKMIFFNEEFISTPGVFYDLDIHIKRKLNWFQPDQYMKLLYTSWVDLEQLRNDTIDKKTQYCSINSSIMCWDENTQRQEIWDYYIKHKDKIEFSFSGIDTFIEHRFPDKYSLYETNRVSSYYKNGIQGDVILFDNEPC